MENSDWEMFKEFPDLGPAETLRMLLEAAGVPARMGSSALESGREARVRVYVVKMLAHRARWVVAQAPVPDQELNYLATGKLPGEEK